MVPQRVAITAAGGGIGRVIAEAFLAQGAHVHVCDNDPASIASAERQGLRASQVDVSDGDQLDRWIDDVLAIGGGLDVLIANAGISGPTALIEDVDPEEWERCLSVGLTSHYRACGRVVPSMKAAGHGSIIHISSSSGLYGVGMRAPYAAAKWAVIGLMKSLAIELGGHGIRVNAVCPGSVDGDRMRGVIEREAAARHSSADDVRREYLQGQSIARFVRPEEVADLCLFLASDAAAMINGQAIAVDGNTETFHIT